MFLWKLIVTASRARKLKNAWDFKLSFCILKFGIEISLNQNVKKDGLRHSIFKHKNEKSRDVSMVMMKIVSDSVDGTFPVLGRFWRFSCCISNMMIHSKLRMRFRVRTCKIQIWKWVKIAMSRSKLKCFLKCFFFKFFSVIRFSYLNHFFLVSLQVWILHWDMWNDFVLQVTCSSLP